MRLRLNQNQMEDVEGITIAYPYVLHEDELCDEETPWHWHEELEFNYVECGEVDIITTERAYTLKAGEGCFVNSNAITKYVHNGKCKVQSHLFHSILLSGHYKSVFETKYVNPVIQNKKVQVVKLKRETLSKLQELYALRTKQNRELLVRNKLSELWLLLIEEIQNLQTEDTAVATVNQERLYSMLQFIHESYADKISLEEIAGAAAISSRECLRCFQLCLKETPIEYLTNYRISVAKELLKTTGKPITDIALETGFSNSAYFSKVFKQICKVTPKEYRNEKSI